MTLTDKKVLVTGGGGFLGSFVLDELHRVGVSQDDISVPRSSKDDLRSWDVCTHVVKGKDLVIHLAGRGGGIGFNQKYPGSTFFDNAIMGTQLIEAARRERVSKFVTIGTVCSYPKLAPIPFRERDLWNGYPEETNAAYGLSKKMLLVQGQAYRQEYGFKSIHLLVVNLYGPRDNFDTEDSHVIPALITKFNNAVISKKRTVTLWGSGNVSREFLYVQDAARGIVQAADKYDSADPVNIGSGEETTIRRLARLIGGLMGFKGEILWDNTRPDGQPKRKLDVSRAESDFGFVAETSLKAGLRNTIDWYLDHIASTNPSQ